MVRYVATVEGKRIKGAVKTVAVSAAVNVFYDTENSLKTVFCVLSYDVVTPTFKRFPFEGLTLKNRPLNVLSASTFRLSPHLAS